MREGGPIEKHKMREGGSEKKSSPFPYPSKWNTDGSPNTVCVKRNAHLIPNF